MFFREKQRVFGSREQQLSSLNIAFNTSNTADYVQIGRKIPLRSVRMDEGLKAGAGLSCRYRLIVKLDIASWKAVLVKNISYHKIS